MCHGLTFESYPQEHLDRLRSYCSLCGKLFIAYEGLSRRIRLRHPDHQGVIEKDLNTRTDATLS